MNRILHVDGLRAIAVLSVVFYHLGFKFFPGGFVGVDIFFVISGYVITQSIKSRLETNSFTLIGFYFGRVRRLTPALLVVVAASLIAATALMTTAHLQEFSHSAIASIFAWSNILYWKQSGYFDTASHLKPLLHTWSLSVEWQFYLFWPIFVIAAVTMKNGRLAQLFLLIALLFSFALNLFWPASSSTIFYLTPFRIFEFCIGALVLWLPRKEDKILLNSIFLVGLLLILYSIFALDAKSVFPSYNALPPTIGAALIIYSGGIARVGLLVNNKLVAYIGKISYSTYLIHWPLIVFYTYATFRPLATNEALIIGAASLLLGAATYHAIEYPLWKGGGRLFRLMPVATAALALALIFPLANAMKDGWSWRLKKMAFSTQNEINAIWGRSGCLEPCEYGNPNAEKIVLIMGDSHVDHYSQTIQTISPNEFRFLHLHGGSCYFGADLVRRSEDPKNDGCIVMNKKKEEWMHQASVVVHAQRWIGYAGILEDRQGMPLKLDDMEELYRAEFNDIEKLYANYSGHVVLMNYVPSAPLSCANRPAYFSLPCPASDIKGTQVFAKMANEFVNRHNNKFSFIDSAELICPNGVCSLFDRRKILFVDDSGHISIYGANRIVPTLMNHIRSITVNP